MARKKFKDTVFRKGDNTFQDEDDSGFITKKIWSYVQATARNTRIPELVSLDDIYKSNPNDQTELFNTFFYKQYSEASNFDINVDCTNN